jgi:hypothetical protein
MGTIYRIALALSLSLIASPAYAYMDPVTGSYLVQGLIAAIMALVVGIKSLRERILRFFRRQKADDDAK